MPKLKVFDKSGKEKGQISLPDEIFGEDVNTDVIHQAIVMYRANSRQGNASTKERSDVRGGGKKPFRQKGTGQARQGSTRSPLWPGGGKVFGPHPRDFSYAVPKNVRRAALRESLNAKYKEEDLICLEDVKGVFNKTKEFAQILKLLKLRGKILACLDGCDATVTRVSSNIGSFSLMRAQDVNAYDVLSNKKILVSKTALQQLIDRLQTEKNASGKVSGEDKES